MTSLASVGLNRAASQSPEWLGLLLDTVRLLPCDVGSEVKQLINTRVHTMYGPKGDNFQE